MFVIATAGHVDHGKSALVQALTGIDPDRLEEEKRRGLTIDLGFAWFNTPSGRLVGIVDVPGHERFIKNMLSGIGSVNGCLFVVAANEGWKPQSQEHLDIIDLLGLRTGVVAITKRDTVSEEDLRAVEADVALKIAGTSLGEAPIVPVSVETREGIEELSAALDAALMSSPPPINTGHSRLWLDRVFTMKGAGIVVTGTLIGGPLVQSDEVRVLPGGSKARIRNIQSYGKELQKVEPGNRVALNLVVFDGPAPERGDVLTASSRWQSTRSIGVSLRFLAHLPHEPTERGAFKFHLGASEVDARLKFVGAIPSKGEMGMAVLRLAEPIVGDFQDRFVLRDSGRRETLGGGLILETHATGLEREQLERRMHARDRTEYLTLLAEENGFLLKSEAFERTGLDVSGSSDEIRVLAKAVYSQDGLQRLLASIVEAVTEYQRDHPLEDGCPRSSLRASVRESQNLFDELVDEALKLGLLIEIQNLLRTPDYEAEEQSPDQQALMGLIDSAGSSPPTFGELADRFPSNLMRSLIRRGSLVQISPELVYTADWIDKLKRRVRSRIEQNGPFTVAEFRDLITTTRKYAVPLLEYLDQIGFTRREGDRRVLGPRA